MVKPAHKTQPQKLSPQLWKGLRIGLLGGSFNPSHEGHIHASEIAMKSLGLDAVWWLVSPGNPLKNNSGLPALELRITNAQKLNSNPKIIVTGIEKEFGTRRSLDTVQCLKKHFPDTDFVWIAGTDIAFEMHRWHRWKDLLELLPLAFVGRPTRFGFTRKNALRELASIKHVHLHNGSKPNFTTKTVFWLYGHKFNSMSSTYIRSKK